MRFAPGISGNLRGRPPGSKNKLPDRSDLINLLHMITDDLTTNYDRLTTGQKIRILTSFSDLYRDSVIISLQTALEEKVKDITFEFDTI
jgi:hypothetical protein